MKVSLRWQVLWAPALALAVATALLGAEAAARARLGRQIAEISRMREAIETGLARLSDRHGRTLRRASEAVLEPQRPSREAILAWTSDHYVKEMERYAAEARSAITGATVSNADPRLPADLGRLNAQVDGVVGQVRTIAPLLDALLTAVAADDPVAVLAATQELERADRVMDSLLRTADAMLRRTAIWQVQQAIASPAAVPRAAWAVLLLWAPLSLYIAQRPLRRVARLAYPGPRPKPAGSPEEEVLGRRLDELETTREAATRQLVERTRDAERAANAIRRVEQELALLRLYNENLVNSLRAAIVVTDAGLRVRSLNRAARHLLGMNEEILDGDIESLPLFTALGRHTQDARGELARALDGHRTLRYESLPYSVGDAEILLDLVIAPYMDESGAARGLLFVADDVTDAVNTKAQLLAAERLAAVGRLSAQVAHEIRNPLSAIGLNAELLGDDFAHELAEPRRSEAGKLLRAIAAEVERLTEVTEGYLRLTRLPRPNLRSIDVNQLVGDLASMLRQEMTAHQITLRLELASPAPMAWVDPGQLRQALLNVLRNSREAMTAGGTVTVSTRLATDGSLVIEVTDDGPGIPADVLPRVLEPFFSTKVAGTGLGLSLTDQIVSDHGGRIRIESTVGRGACVGIVLPPGPPPPATARTQGDDAETDA